MDSSANMLGVNPPGVPTGSQCDDDLGIFHGDIERTSYSEAHRGQPLFVNLKGTTDRHMEIDNIHVDVRWNGVTLYTEDHPEHRVFEDEVWVDLDWYLPTVTPAGNFLA